MKRIWKILAGIFFIIVLITGVWHPSRVWAQPGSIEEVTEIQAEIQRKGPFSIYIDGNPYQVNSHTTIKSEDGQVLSLTLVEAPVMARIKYYLPDTDDEGRPPVVTEILILGNQPR